jgi:hypothetical protein
MFPREERVGKRLASKRKEVNKVGVNEDRSAEFFNYGPPRAKASGSKSRGVGPSAVESGQDVGGWVHETNIGPTVRPGTSAPAHRRPGAKTLASQQMPDWMA